MTFLDENFEKTMLNSFNSKKRKNGIEDQKIKKTKSIHSKSVDRWKSDLKPKEIKYIIKKCNKLFTQFNYNIPT